MLTMMNHDEPSFLMDSTVENCTPDAMILPVLGCQVGAGQNNHLQLETTWDVRSRTPIVLYHFVSVKFIFRKSVSILFRGFALAQRTFPNARKVRNIRDQAWHWYVSWRWSLTQKNLSHRSFPQHHHSSHVVENETYLKPPTTSIIVDIPISYIFILYLYKYITYIVLPIYINHLNLKHLNWTPCHGYSSPAGLIENPSNCRRLFAACRLHPCAFRDISSFT